MPENSFRQKLSLLSVARLFARIRSLMSFDGLGEGADNGASHGWICYGDVALNRVFGPRVQVTSSFRVS